MITNGPPGRASSVPTARRQATTIYRQAGWAVLRVLVSIAAVLQRRQQRQPQASLGGQP